MTGRTSARTRMRAIATYLATLAIGLTLSCAVTSGMAAADPPEPGAAPAPPAATDPPSATSESSPTEQPPSPQQPVAKAAAQVELEVTADFDKPTYHSGDLIKVTFRIKNTGTEKANHLTVSNIFSDQDELQFDPRQLGDLGNQNGVKLDPGASHEVVLSGNPARADSTVVRLNGNVFEEGRRVADFDFHAPIEKRLGQVAGRVFGDKNGNGKLDRGEELSGIKITLGYRQSRLSAISDADGHFDFGKIPTVEYFTGGEVVDGWLFPFDRIVVDESDKNSDLLIRGAPPLNGALHAGMKFTKDTYQQGELAHITVTLSNSGQIPLTGIVAACDRGGFDSSLDGNGPGWSDLAFFSKGVTIAPGKTLTLDVTDTIPKGAFLVGRVSVGCDFGYREVDIENHAFAGDDAKVPGGIGSIVGEVQNFPNGHGNGQQGEGVGGVRLVLVDKRDCPIVGETTTDDKGHFEFHDVAAGSDYELFILPPAGWKVKFDNPTPAEVVAVPTPSRLFLEVEHGDAPLPTVPTQPNGCTGGSTPTPTPTEPAPQGRSDSGLASTGASVVGLSALGAVALLLGGGAVLTTRRRRRNAES